VILVAALTVAVAAVLLRDDRSTSTGGGLEGSGNAATETRDVGAFDAVELAGANNVTVRVGRDRSVVVNGDDNLLDRVTTEVAAARLVIDNRGGFSTNSPMSVDVTVPSLRAITLSGSGNIDAADVHAERLVVRLSGSGNIRAAGEATHLRVTLIGSGDVELVQLVARHVDADLRTSGHIAVRATDSLDASVAGTGAITYVGDPAHVTKNVTGNGAIVGT
jgi:hypothetical protein